MSRLPKSTSPPLKPLSRNSMLKYDQCLVLRWSNHSVFLLRNLGSRMVHIVAWLQNGTEMNRTLYGVNSQGLSSSSRILEAVQNLLHSYLDSDGSPIITQTQAQLILTEVQNLLLKASPAIRWIKLDQRRDNG